MQVFARSPKNSLRQCSRDIGIEKSTVHRILRAQKRYSISNNPDGMPLCSTTLLEVYCGTVAYLEFGWGGGCPASPTCSKGTISLNYNNFVHSENTISEHMAIFKVNIQNFFRFCIHFFNFKLYYFEIGNSA